MSRSTPDRPVTIPNKDIVGRIVTLPAQYVAGTGEVEEDASFHPGHSPGSVGGYQVSLNLLYSLVRPIDSWKTSLRACGMAAAPVTRARSWRRWRSQAAKQPDVLVLDLRGQAHLPAALPLLKRQHPSTGVLIVADRLEPALLLEAMRAGVTELVAAPLVANDIDAAISRLAAQRSVTPRQRHGTGVCRRQGRSGHDDDRRQRGGDAGTAACLAARC